MNKRVGIIIPVANEERTIVEFTNLLLDECDKLDGYKIDIFYIMDSFNKDQTDKLIINNFDNRVKILFHENSTGLVSCYLYGYKHCVKEKYDFVIEMDSGFSHRPEHIKGFVDKLEQGSDAVFASRFLKESNYETTKYRKAISKIGTIVANLWLDMSYSDATSGFQAFKYDVLKDIEFDNFISFGGMFQTEMKYYIFNRF